MRCNIVYINAYSNTINLHLKFTKNIYNVYFKTII